MKMEQWNVAIDEIYSQARSLTTEELEELRDRISTAILIKKIRKAKEKLDAFKSKLDKS